MFPKCSFYFITLLKQTYKLSHLKCVILKKLTLETTSSSINKILNFQKIGTLLALLYAIISFALGFIFLTTYYCVPLFISGILMVYCFWGHYKNNKMIENIDGSCWLISLLNTLFKINKINKMIEPKNIENT